MCSMATCIQQAYKRPAWVTWLKHTTSTTSHQPGPATQLITLHFSRHHPGNILYAMPLPLLNVRSHTMNQGGVYYNHCDNSMGVACKLPRSHHGNDCALPWLISCTSLWERFAMGELYCVCVTMKIITMCFYYTLTAAHAVSSEASLISVITSQDTPYRKAMCLKHKGQLMNAYVGHGQRETCGSQNQTWFEALHRSETIYCMRSQDAKAWSPRSNGRRRRCSECRTTVEGT